MKKSEYIRVRIDPVYKIYLEMLAKTEHRTLNFIVNRIVSDYVKSHIKSKQREYFESQYLK